jgi:hypothetical protein
LLLSLKFVSLIIKNLTSRDKYHSINFFNQLLKVSSTSCSISEIKYFDDLGVTIDGVLIGYWIYWPLIHGTTSHHSATANLHTVQITIAPAKFFYSLQCLHQPFPGNGFWQSNLQSESPSILIENRDSIEYLYEPLVTGYLSTILLYSFPWQLHGLFRAQMVSGALQASYSLYAGSSFSNFADIAWTKALLSKQHLRPCHSSGGYSLASRRGGPGSRPSQVMRDLWWTKWH